jgi:large subunit ribosomal protein L10
MRKEEKQEIVEALADQIKTNGNFYITDTADLTVVKVSDIRRKCFESGISMQVAKNTLIRKAMELAGVDSEEFNDVLKGSSTLLFSSIGNAPAKLIKDLRKTGPKPILKGAFIDSAVFIGDDKIDMLASLKSKEELVGDIIGLLQSPAKNVVSALQSSGNKLAGIVKTLQEREG